MITKYGYELTPTEKNTDWWPIDGSCLDEKTLWAKAIAYKVVGASGEVRFPYREAAFAEMCNRLSHDVTANYHPVYT